MLFSTPTQFIVLALALVAGWLLGLASHSGGAKWKERYATEREAHAAARRDADTRVAESNRLTAEARRGTDDRLIQANARITELERENARLAKTQPLTTAMPERTISERTVPGDTPVYMATAARPAFTRTQGQPGAKRGWFDF